MNINQIKKYLLYGLKWQGGTPIITGILWLLPINSILIKTIIANIVGAIIFYPIDKRIFKIKEK